MDARPSLVRSLTRDLAVCLGFYTRLKLPPFGPPAHGFANAQWAAPLAGAVVGAAGATVLAGGLLAGLPALPVAALALAATIAMSGALHEDGLADVADGFGGGATREKKLTIMKDSRIGSYGMCALGLSLLIRWSALATLAAAGWAVAASFLIIAHVASRALIPAMMATLPPARETGLSAGAGQPGRQTVFAALCLGAFTLSLGGMPFFMVAGAFLGLCFFFLKRLSRKQIGGQTGDVLGALQQTGEAAILLAACIHFT